MTRSVVATIGSVFAVREDHLGENDGHREAEYAPGNATEPHHCETRVSGLRLGRKLVDSRSGERLRAARLRRHR
jgi:hypothetical protein